MLKSLLVIAVAGLSCLPAWPQQNIDIYVGFGNLHSRTYQVNGTNITAYGSSVFGNETAWGYQMARLSSTSLWLDIDQLFGSPGNLQANVSGTGRSTWQAFTAGVRLMAPIGKRLSPYAVTGVGGGLFHAVAVHPDAATVVSTYRTYHGVFDFGGGVDFRLLRWFSLRGEVKDLVTGDQLSGAAGRHHLMPLAGIAFHI